jgi:transcriptional regulator with XRE-family HTH domain
MDQDIYRHVGRRVREERTRRDWTQEQLAERAETHLSFVGQIERGVKKPSLRTIKRLADVFGIRAGDLLDEAEPAATPYPWVSKVADLLRDRPPEQQEFLYTTLRHLARQTKKIDAP